MEEFDIIIIGAGVVGLAIAKELSGTGRNILLVDRNKTFGQETSSRNSEVIHGGMYYPAGSLKANLCVEGRRRLYKLCEKNGIPHKKTGKLIVATEDDEKSALQKLLALGTANGVEDLQILTNERIEKMEPNIVCLYALYSPHTGIIDSHRLMKFYLDSAQDKGVMAVFNALALSIEKEKNEYIVVINNAGEIIKISAKIVINSAGLNSDVVAAMTGIDINKSMYRLHYCKGQYFRISDKKANMLKSLVYPVPKPKAGGLGIHATIDLAGSIRLGPDDEYMPDNIQDYSIDVSKAEKFLQSAKIFLPFIETSDLTPDTSGIRPKLQKPNCEFRDFVIRDEKDKGLPGFINLIGIESPGLTASPAIGEYVKELTKNILN